MRVPWTTRRSNQSILKEINLKYSLERLKLKHQYLGHLISRADSLGKTLMLGKIEAESITNSQSLRKLMSIESVMPSNHLILCCPLLVPLSVFPSIRVFSNESVLHMRWPKCWSFSFSNSPSNEYSGLISFRIDFF